jgi:cytochrome P450
MRSYEATVGEIVTAEIDSWQPGREFPIHRRMQAITLEVILRAVFGVAEGPRLDVLRGLLRDLLAATGSTRVQLRALFARRTGADPLAEVRARLGEVDAALFAEIAEHRLRPDLEERTDILSMLMTARFEDGSAMDEKELRDQLMTLLLAGHETTATALAWTFDLLLRHPVALGRLRASLEAGEEAYLKATIEESLRLRPVVPLAGRRLGTELVAGDLRLPAGTDVTPAIWLVHTRPDVYAEPFAFRPERFLQSGPDTYSWIPYGGSVRRCLGAAFAEFEMRIALRAILTRCEIRKADPMPERVARRNVTLSPRDGTRVIVSSRHPARDRAFVAV